VNVLVRRHNHTRVFYDAPSTQMRAVEELRLQLRAVQSPPTARNQGDRSSEYSVRAPAIRECSSPLIVPLSTRLVCDTLLKDVENHAWVGTRCLLTALRCWKRTPRRRRLIARWPR
jgi:hypothetical protein